MAGQSPLLKLQRQIAEVNKLADHLGNSERPGVIVDQRKVLSEVLALLGAAVHEMERIEARVTAQDERIAALETARKAESNLAWEDPFYWILEGEKKAGPYCRDCYAKKQQLVGLSEEQADGQRACPSCMAVYKKPRERFDSLSIDPHFNV